MNYYHSRETFEELQGRLEAPWTAYETEATYSVGNKRFNKDLIVFQYPIPGGIMSFKELGDIFPTLQKAYRRDFIYDRQPSSHGLHITKPNEKFSAVRIALEWPVPDDIIDRLDYMTELIVKNTFSVVVPNLDRHVIR